MPQLTLVTRRSRLALTQTQWLVDQLVAAHPGLEVRLLERTTVGDRVLDRPLPEVGGKGVFTEELEAALRSGEADLAVHSLKDLPTDLPADLTIGAVPPRAEPRDALVLPAGAPAADAADPLAALPAGAVVGTSSNRRVALLAAARPDLRPRSVRGNVETRLAKLDSGEYQALLLAAAGLERLGLGARISALLPPELLTPAPAQGALGVECRAGDDRVLGLLAAVDDAATRAAVRAERAFLAAMGGGCSLPVGALAEPVGEGLRLRVAVAHPAGVAVLRREAVAPAAEAEALGRRLAEVLLSEGADRLLAASREG